MITRNTAAEIWECYREIAAAKKLLRDMDKERERVARDGQQDAFEPKLADAFGRRRNLQLGIPCGDNGHTLYAVAPELAESVIRAHIANQQARLVAANERARIELDVVGEPTPEAPANAD